jgi:hypothetical protein
MTVLDLRPPPPRDRVTDLEIFLLLLLGWQPRRR